MTPYVEQLRRSEKRIYLIERSFQIFRILLSNDQADRGGLPSILAQGSGVVLSGIFHAFRYQFFRPLRACRARQSESFFRSRGSLRIAKSSGDRVLKPYGHALWFSGQVSEWCGGGLSDHE